MSSLSNLLLLAVVTVGLVGCSLAGPGFRMAGEGERGTQELDDGPVPDLRS